MIICILRDLCRLFYGIVSTCQLHDLVTSICSSESICTYCTLLPLSLLIDISKFAQLLYQGKMVRFYLGLSVVKDNKTTKDWDLINGFNLTTLFCAWPKPKLPCRSSSGPHTTLYPEGEPCSEADMKTVQSLTQAITSNVIRRGLLHGHWLFDVLVLLELLTITV